MGDKKDLADVERWGEIDVVEDKRQTADKIDELVTHLAKLREQYFEGVRSDDPYLCSDELSAVQSLISDIFDDGAVSNAMSRKRYLHSRLSMLAREANLADQYVEIHKTLEPRTPEYYYNILQWNRANFAGVFLSMFDEWRRTRDIGVIEEIREVFLESMLVIAELYEASRFSTHAEELCLLKELALEDHKRRLGFDDEDLPFVPDIPPVPFLEGFDGGVAPFHQDSDSEVESVDDNAKRLWQEYVIKSGGDKGAFTKIADIPDDIKDFFFLNQYIHVFDAMHAVFFGEFEAAANSIEKVGDYELDATGDCFVGSLLDSIALLDRDIAPRADAKWSAVKKKLFIDSSDIDLEMICGDTHRRSVGVLASNKVKKGTMIIRKYNLSDPDALRSGERDIALSRFAERAVGDERIVPRELACFEKDGWLYHVETRIPGMSLEQQVAAGDSRRILIEKSLLTILKYQDYLSGAFYSEPELKGLLHRPDYNLEFSAKFLDRLKGLSEYSYISFDYEAASQAMADVLRFLEIAPEGVVHNDARGANIIISPGDFAGIIDLEKTALGKFLFDIVGFVEHTKVESGIKIDYDPYRRFTHNREGIRYKEGSPNYYRLIIPAACVFKMSHLCGSAIKYHLDPEAWDLTGRDRVCSYLAGMAEYAGALRKFSSGVLSSAAEELKSLFITLEDSLRGIKL